MSFLSYNYFMQQYFIDKKLNVGDTVLLEDEILYHLIKVLRKDSSYTFRLCDNTNTFYHCHLISNKECMVDEKLDENNELDCDITCIMALIKNDKFELCVQKLVELGVKRIVPYQAYRSVVKSKDDKKVIRIKKIVKEAAEQSHRNIIPEVTDVASIKDLNKYLSKSNYICFESEKNIVDIDVKDSITYIIGPEGGFEDSEYKKIVDLGFESISLGKRILRAETAAIYMTSIIVGKCQ